MRGLRVTLILGYKYFIWANGSQFVDHETWWQRHCQEVKKKKKLTFLIYLLKHMEVVLEMERVVSEKTSKITIGHYIY